jgi:hypothetical protein
MIGTRTLSLEESPEDVVRAALRRVKKGKKKIPSEAEKRLMDR